MNPEKSCDNQEQEEGKMGWCWSKRTKFQLVRQDKS